MSYIDCIYCTDIEHVGSFYSGICNENLRIELGELILILLGNCVGCYVGLGCDWVGLDGVFGV